MTCATGWTVLKQPVGATCFGTPISQVEGRCALARTASHKRTGRCAHWVSPWQSPARSAMDSTRSIARASSLQDNLSSSLVQRPRLPGQRGEPTSAPDQVVIRNSVPQMLELGWSLYEGQRPPAIESLGWPSNSDVFRSSWTYSCSILPYAHVTCDGLVSPTLFGSVDYCF